MAERPLKEWERKKILERDGYTSQMRHYDEVRGWHTGCDNCPHPDKQSVQVHHVNPNGNGGSNDPSNLLTIFECEHNGRRCDGSLVDPSEEFVVHPDMVQGFKKYREGNTNAIAEVMQARKPLKEKGDIYWDTTHDAEMKQTAEERTLNAVNNGWRFLPKRKRS